MSYEHMNAELANVAEQVRDLIRDKRQDGTEEKLGTLHEALLKMLGLLEDVAMAVGEAERRLDVLELSRGRAESRLDEVERRFEA